MTASSRHRALTFGLLLTATLAAPPAGAQSSPSSLPFERIPGKLAKDVVPMAYRLDLKPDLDKLALTGAEEIDIDVAKPVDTITLDAVGFTFDQVQMKDLGAAATVTLDAKAETASFHFAKPIPAGHHTLAVAYHGAIPETPAGLYYDDYDTAQGKKRMLVSQFESTDARRAFPSWDEPAFKATFALSVTLPADLAVISNMPAAAEHAAGADGHGVALKKTDFATTPRMSTYLLVLCAGDLERIHDTSTGTDIGVWAVRGKAEQGRVALEAAVRLLPYYNDYFGVKYPLPKMDMIAVPGNYQAGAMENWGGLTFIDNALLFDPKTSSEATRQVVFSVVAHEMAHQWSGDLVTMAWWDNTWLNEGFAEWMDAKATDALNPSWQYWLNQHADKERAMATDAHSTTHPIEIPIQDESVIDLAFDSISYQKGEAFIRMLETWLGPDAFRDGMRRYMAKFAYGNSVTADLWAELGAASGRDVAAMAGGFTSQKGIPLIEVESRCEKGHTEVTLTQSRFTINDPQAPAQSWRVPVQLALVGKESAARTVLVENGKAKTSLDGCGTVKANSGDVGYFRTLYDAKGYKALVSAYPHMTAADRVNFVTDSWALVAAGKLSPAAYLDLLGSLKSETAPVVWTGVLTSLGEIDDALRGSAERAAFHTFAIGLLTPALDHFGWDAKSSDDSQTKLIRAPLIAALGRYGSAPVVAESRRRFTAFEADAAALPPDIRGAVVANVVRAGGKAEFDKVRALGKQSSSTEERLRYYVALAAETKPELTDEAVKVALTDEIPNGRVVRYLYEVLRQSDDQLRVWHDILDIRGTLLPKVPEEVRSLALPTAAGVTGDPAIGRELQALPEATANEGSRLATEKAIEAIDWKVRFKAQLAPATEAWLKKGH
jgi:aminopeptidase N